MPIATRKIFASSPIPNHRMTSGMIARCGTLRSICIEESNTVSAGREMPASTPRTKPMPPPMTRPLSARSVEIAAWVSERAVAEAVPEGDGHGARRRQQPARQQPAARGDLPHDDEADRQRPGRQQLDRCRCLRPGAGSARPCSGRRFAAGRISLAMVSPNGPVLTASVGPSPARAPAAAAGRPARRSGRPPRDAGSRRG